VPSVHITIPLRPYPMPRPRCSCRGGFARVYNSSVATKWKEGAAKYIADGWRAGGQYLLVLTDAPVGVELVFHWPNGVAHARTCDLDNLSKSVLDAATDAGIWDDDRRVTYLTAAKLIRPGVPAGVNMTVTWE
jgi:Holliday junction resolvase RusA-like endonuclease